MYKVKESPLETQRFGVSSFKIEDISLSEISLALQELKDLKADYCSIRISTDEIDVMQALEHEGFFLTDTLVYYKCKIDKPKDTDDRGLTYRLAVLQDAEQVKNISRLTFKGYFGHYHADSNFPSELSDAVYEDWAHKSVLHKNVADDVILALDNDQIVAFATMKKYADSGEGILFGVHPEYQGRGIYRNLIRRSMNWCLEKKLPQVLYSTQINNYAVQKTWIRENCEIFKSYYTLHKWFK